MRKKSIMSITFIFVALLCISINLFNNYLVKESAFLSDNLKIIVNIKPDSSYSDIQSLQAQIATMYGVVRVQYSSKEDILKELGNDFGTQFNYIDNPFYDQIILIIKPGIDTSDLVNTIDSSDMVQGCEFDLSYIKKIEQRMSILKRISQMVFWVGNIALIFIGIVTTAYFFEEEIRKSNEVKREVLFKVLLFWIISGVISYIIIAVLLKYILSGGNPVILEQFGLMNCIKISVIYVSIIVLLSLLFLGSIKGEE